MKQVLILTALASILAGCSSSGDAQMSKADDDTAKNNFTRALTPAEQAKMNGGPAPGTPAPPLHGK